MKPVAWWGLAAAAAAILWWGTRPARPEVEVVRLERGPVVEELVAEGRTRAVEHYRISAPVAGYLRRHGLRVGDEVRAGQVLASLTPLPVNLLDARAKSEAEARLAQAAALARAARAEHAAARAVAELAEREQARLARLRKTGAVSAEAVDTAASAARVAGARLAASEQAATAAEAARSAMDSVLRPGAPSIEPIAMAAPADGVITARFRESEGVVQAGEALLEIGDTSQLELAADLLSEDAVRIAPGTPLVLDNWGGGRRLLGTVTRIEPVAFTKISALGVEEQRVWVIARLDEPAAAQRLGDGYRGDVRYQLARAEGVLRLPASALFREEGGWFVYALRDDALERRGVVPGLRGGFWVELRQGLAEGALVVMNPEGEMHDGQAVTPVPRRLDGLD